MKIVGVILASGKGERTGSYIPKQFIKIHGKPVIDYTINTFRQTGMQVVVTTPPGYTSSALEAHKDIIIIPGGNTRTETIRNTFSLLEALGADYVIYHDSARPLIQTKIILEIQNLLINGCDALVTGAKITDSLVRHSELPILVDREEYRLIQTPEAFRVKKLIRAYKGLVEQPTIIAGSLMEDPTFRILDSEAINFKITYPEDIRIAEKLLVEDNISPRLSNNIDSLYGKTALVLGGSGGIGKIIIENLKKYCDVDFPTRAEIDLDRLWIITKKYDYIIYSAGLCYPDSNITEAEKLSMFNVNTLSVDKLLRDAKNIVNPGGAILIIGSSSSTMGRSNFGLYSASKVATNAIVQANCKRLYRNGIRVNCLCPTKTNTPMVKKTATIEDAEHILEPEQVAEVVLNILTLPDYGKIWYMYKGLDKPAKTN